MIIMRRVVWLTVVVFAGAVRTELPSTTAKSTLSLSPPPPTPPLSSSVSSQVGQAALSVYLVASEMALKVHESVIHPVVQFWKDQEAAALERKWKAKEQRAAQYDAIDQQQRPATDRIDDTQTPSWTTSPQQQSSNIVSSLGVASNNKDTRTSSKAITLIVSPRRCVKVMVAAWLLAEALDRLGILHDDTPQLLRSQIDRLWFDLESRWNAVRVRLETATVQSNKPPFALGVVVGMMVSPLAALAWQPLLAVVCLAEWNTHRRMHGRWHLGALVGDGLERIRYQVRELLQLPPTSSTGTDQGTMLLIHPRKNGGSISQSHGSRDLGPSIMTKSRTIGRGQGQSTAGRSQGRTLTTKSGNKRGWITQSTSGDHGGRTLLIKSGGSSTQNRPKAWLWRVRNNVKSVPAIQDEVEQRNRFRDLVRHGAFVGSLLGFMSGL